MRRPSFVLLSSVFLAACTEPDTKVIPAAVRWMEWPAEVLAGTPFSIRISGYGPGCYETIEFHAPVTVDISSVTVEPYFLVDGDDLNVLCERSLNPMARDPGYFDTRVAVPGLTPSFPRSYEIRGARAFGEIIVRSDSADATHLNVGGEVSTYRDSLGCPWISPAFFLSYVMENPPDTVTYWHGFVRGYVHSVTPPLCGESRVFHLESRN